MTWKIEFEATARKQFQDLDRLTARRIGKFLLERVAVLEDPRSIAEPLKGTDYKGYWRYRVGDYRLICNIEGDRLTITIIELGHRREVYR